MVRGGHHNHTCYYRTDGYQPSPQPAPQMPPELACCIWSALAVQARGPVARRQPRLWGSWPLLGTAASQREAAGPCCHGWAWFVWRVWVVWREGVAAHQPPAHVVQAADISTSGALQKSAAGTPTPPHGALSSKTQLAPPPPASAARGQWSLRIQPSLS